MYVYIVGLTNNGNGRSCNMHDICKAVDGIGSMLNVWCAPAWRRERWWNDVVVYLVEQGVNKCKVGFWSKEYEADASFLDGCYIRTVTLYTNVDDGITRRMS